MYFYIVENGIVTNSIVCTVEDAPGVGAIADERYFDIGDPWEPMPEPSPEPEAPTPFDLLAAAYLEGVNEA